MATAVFGQAHGALERAAALVGEARADFAHQSQQLDGQIAELAGRWTGEGARAFFELHRTWVEQHRRVVGALDHFAEALVATARDNTRADEQSAAALAQLTGRLGAV